MSATLNEKPNTTGVDAQGNTVDLSDFEESYYKPGEVEATLEDYFESFESITEGQIINKIDIYTHQPGSITRLGHCPNRFSSARIMKKQI